MSTVIIRNGRELCAKCEKRGCLKYWPGMMVEDVEEPHVSDEPCSCCEDVIESSDGFGI